MSDVGDILITMFGEEDCKIIAMMYAKLYIDTGSIEFAQMAGSLFESFLEIGREWVNGLTGAGE